MNRGWETGQEGGHFGRGPLEFPFFYCCFPKGENGRESENTDIKRWHLNRHFYIFSFLRHKSSHSDPCPSQERVFKARRSAQQGPLPLLCLGTAPSNPLLSLLPLCFFLTKTVVASYFPTKPEIYTREQEGLWESCVFCLWLVFYPPSFVLSFSCSSLKGGSLFSKIADWQNVVTELFYFSSPLFLILHVHMCFSGWCSVNLEYPYLS